MNKLLLFALIFALLFTSCTPTPPSVTTADAVATVEEFYKFINDAQAEDDLLKSWMMLTLEEQCNPRDQCTLGFFQDNWWPWLVNYDLYGCSPTRVIAKETLISREGNATSTPPSPRYWRYELIETEAGLMISDRRLAQAPGDDCALTVEKTMVP